MKKDPGAPRKKVVSHVKAKIQAKDSTSRLAHTTSLPVQRLRCGNLRAVSASTGPLPSSASQTLHACTYVVRPLVS